MFLSYDFLREYCITYHTSEYYSPTSMNLSSLATVLRLLSLVRVPGPARGSGQTRVSSKDL